MEEMKGTTLPSTPEHSRPVAGEALLLTASRETKVKQKCDLCPTCISTPLRMLEGGKKYCSLCKSYRDPRRNIGFHLKYINPQTKKPQSRLKTYLSKGLRLSGGNDTIKLENEKSALLTKMQSGKKDTPSLRGDMTNEESQMKVENLILTCFPKSAFARFLKELETSEGDIQFEEMTTEMFVAIWRILTSDYEASFTWEDEGVPMRVYGRKNGYKTMTKVVTVINKLHELAGKPSPCSQPEPQKWMTRVRVMFHREL